MTPFCLCYIPIRCRVKANISGSVIYQRKTLQSGNVNRYQNIFLICLTALLNSCYQGVLRIKTFIHTETQDGKTVLDANFARCIRFLSHFMRTWKRNKITRINSAKGLAFALALNGGMKNVIVHAIKTDRTQINNIQNVFEAMILKNEAVPYSISIM